jgi:hypothetical protein
MAAGLILFLLLLGEKGPRPTRFPFQRRCVALSSPSFFLFTQLPFLDLTCKPGFSVFRQKLVDDERMSIASIPLPVGKDERKKPRHLHAPSQPQTRGKAKVSHAILHPRLLVVLERKTVD